MKTVLRELDEFSVVLVRVNSWIRRSTPAQTIHEFTRNGPLKTPGLLHSNQNIASVLRLIAGIVRSNNPQHVVTFWQLACVPNA